jgi:PAS domain S-box-containing protein
MISVLLIDQVQEKSSIHKLLSSSPNGFNLNYASTYREILEGFRSKAYDVCLIDSALEIGLKLITQARSVGCITPIVLITSNDACEAISAIQHGVADCLIRDDLSAAAIEHSLCYVVEQARNISLQNQRERRYLALLDNANKIVYTHDLEGNFTSINRTGEQLLGYSQSEIMEMNVWQLMVPEYRVLVQKMIARTLDAQTQTAEEVELVTKDGCNLRLEINTHPINHYGRTIEIQAIAATPVELFLDRPFDSRCLSMQSESSAVLEEHQELMLHAYEAVNSFLLQDNSSKFGRTLFSL